MVLPRLFHSLLPKFRNGDSSLGVEMSTGSFDDSSNLVVEVTSPTSPNNPDKDAVFDKTSSEEFSEKHSKKSKGFGFLGKHAKSPIKSPIKSPFKIPFKSKSPSKSSAKSPSKEILSDDIKDIEEKIADKTGEEWQAFQQMQDRIKQTVIQSQSTLKKLSDQPSDSQCDQYGKKEASWTSFDDSTSLIRKDSESNDNHTATNLVSYDDGVKNTEIDDKPIIDLDQLSVTPIPRVPQNSLTSSMEDLLNDNVDISKTAPVEQDVDLLGLSDVTEDPRPRKTDEVIMNEDLLGLDSLMSSTVAMPPEGVMEPSYPQSSDYMGSILSQSQFSSNRSTPLSLEQEPDIFLDKDQVVPAETSSFVDEFLQLDDSDKVETAENTSANVSASLNPFHSDSTLETQPEVTVNMDLFIDDKKQVFPDVKEKEKSDPFDAINPFPTAKEEKLTLKQLADRDKMAAIKPGTNVSDADIALDSLDSLGSEQAQPSVAETEIFGDMDAFGVPMTANNPFLVDASASPVPTAGIVQDFVEDFFESKLPSEDIPLSNKTTSVWGGDAVDMMHDSKGDNPFQDDLFTMDKVPENLESRPQAESTNPFLSGISAPSAAATTWNPFLELDTASPADSGINLSETDKFQIEHATGANTQGEGMVSDDFDPFGVNVVTSTETKQDIDAFTVVSSMGDQQLVQSAADNEDDDEFVFNLEIKPAGVTVDTLSSPPLIQPPPVISPHPPRDNPFDRDSPPEENFAKFEILGDKGKVEPTKSMSMDSSTSEEYEPPTEPLEIFHPKYEKDGWKLMLRQPPKKKLTGNRFWKEIFVKIVKQSDGPTIKLYYNETDSEPFKELPLQPCYSVSEIALQQYDQFGKIFTLKLQYIFYKERVGIRPDRITSSFVRKPKTTMMLDHSPQVSELLKFGCLDRNELRTFVWEIEDALLSIEAHREKTLTYNKDEVTADVCDEFKAVIDKHGKVLSQKARVRIFLLAFLTGMPACELGINDKRRRGKEVVGRHDIMPIKTEEWIRYEDIEFHCCVDQEEFKRSNNIKLRPLDACQFEVMRFRIYLRENKELPLQLTVEQIMKGLHVEIRCDLLVTGYHAFSKKHGQFPCEDIEVRFPIPEQWIYLFRYERRFGYGSLHSSKRKPGKIKGLERITAMAQGALTPALMEADVGTAKYENVCKCVVWRISRLPERNEGAYTNHLFRLTLDLGPHDEIPESFAEYADVEFTMPASTISQTQVRSISVENPNPPEKWVRYIAKYEYQVEIDHVQQGSDSGNSSE
ncbi:hypothetical protein ScPMuIL_014742 [Solemya velum]